MQTQKTTIKVSRETAEAYQRVTPEQRRRAEVAMTIALMTREEAVRRLEHLMDEISDYAETQGWNEEKEAALLI